MGSVTLPVRLTPHFSTREFEVTDTDIANRIPDQGTWWRIRCLCSAVLEPLRERLLVPIRITSGHRTHAVNVAIGGSSTTDHRAEDDADDGAAADIIAIGASQRQTWGHLLAMIDAGLPVDQAIFYPHTGHIHVSHRIAVRNRRQMLIAHPDGTYTEAA